MAKKYLLITVLVFAALIGGLVFSSSKVERAQADADKPINGWAWSSNIGWINFNCQTAGPNKSNICGTSNYGVTLLSPDANNNGSLSGYAWSSNIGWINFAGTSITNGTLTGFAQAVSGNTPQAGGWDGKIKLSDSASPAYGATLSGDKTKIQGFSWGSDVVGWVNFYPDVANDVGVVIGPPTAGGLTVQCTASPVNALPNATVTWTVTSVTGGSGGPYTYVWTNATAGSPASSATANVGTGDVNHQYSASAQVTETSSGKVGVCSAPVNVVCPGNQVWQGNTCVDPDNPTPGTSPDLSIASDSTNRISIVQQSTGAKAATRPIVLVNNGDATVSNIKVVSAVSASTGASLSSIDYQGAKAMCRLTTSQQATDSDWYPCDAMPGATLQPLNLGPNNKLYFSIQIPSYKKDFNTNSPYTVTIRGKDASDNVVPLKKAGQITTVDFQYLVGGVNPI